MCILHGCPYLSLMLVSGRSLTVALPSTYVCESLTSRLAIFAKWPDVHLNMCLTIVLRVQVVCSKSISSPHLWQAPMHACEARPISKIPVGFANRAAVLHGVGPWARPMGDCCSFRNSFCPLQQEITPPVLVPSRTCKLLPPMTTGDNSSCVGPQQDL